LLFKGEVENVYITRPVVTREEIGFLPGGIAEKLDPFLIPIYDCLRALYSDENKIKQLFNDKIIDIAPIAFMRGRTVKNAVMIIDEAQNCQGEDLKMCLSRLGSGGKIIVCGDKAQIDLKHQNLSGLPFLTTLCGKIEGFTCVELLINHRDPIVDEILKHYEINEAQTVMMKTLTNQYVKKTGS
jgi:phosphate starvation-inducible PhoH-like protein